MSFLFSQPAPGVLPANSVDFSEVETIGASTLLGNKLGAESTIQELSVSDVSTLLNLASLQPLDSDLTAIAGLSPANDDLIQRKSGVWTNRTPAQFKTDLSLTKSDVGLSNVANVDQTNASNISSGTLSISYGGTGQTTANAALNALLPPQGSNNGKYLTTDGSNTSWATVTAGVTSVSASSPLASSGGSTPNITISQASAVSNGYLSSADFSTFNSKMSNPMTTAGDIIVGGASGSPGRLALGTVDKVLVSDGTTVTYQYAGLGGGTFPSNTIILGRAKPAGMTSTNSLLIGVGSNENGGNDNIAIGNNAYGGIGGNTVIGSGATVTNNPQGYDSIAIGYLASAAGECGVSVGRSSNGGRNSTIIGYGANDVTVGSGVLVGRDTYSSGLGGVVLGRTAKARSDYAISIGYGTDTGTSAATGGIVIGYNSGKSTLSGANNTILGSSSFNNASLTTAANNVIVGQGSATAMTTASNCIVLGQGSGTGLTTGTYNILMGSTGNSITTSSSNVVLGYAGTVPATGSQMTVVGMNAGANSNSTAIGYGADARSTDGIAIGRSSNCISGNGSIVIGTVVNSYATNYSIGIGYIASCSSGTANAYNVVIGANAGKAYTNIGPYNTLIGAYCGTALNTTTSNCVFLGYSAGRYNTTQSNEFFVDNQDRTNYAGQQSGSLLYGTFNATASSQTLKINAATTSTYGYLTALGSVTTPTYSFTGDTNTGLWSSAADTVNLSTGGSERLRVDSSGNVGIGTTSPGAKLEVSGDVKVSSGDLSIATVGKGLAIKSGTNAKIGLASGTSPIAVSTSALVGMTNPVIFVTTQNGNDSASVDNIDTIAGTFDILHSAGSTSRDVAWIIIETA